MAKASLVLLATSLIALLMLPGAPIRESLEPYVLFDEGEESSLATDAGQNWIEIEVTAATFLPSAELLSGELLEIDLPVTYSANTRAVKWLDRIDLEETKTDFTLNLGKKWDVSSPSLTGTVDAGYYRGNLGIRAARFRSARFEVFSDALLITLQGSFKQSLLTDLPDDYRVRGALVDWPQILGRLDLTLGFAPEPAKPHSWALQVTSALGFLEASPPPLSMPLEGDARFESWSMSVDLQVPVSDPFSCRGVFYTGVYSRLRGLKHSTSSRCEISYDWTPRWHSRIGVGIDDPDGFPRQTHHLIFVHFASLSFDLTDHLATGIEVAFRETLYPDNPGGTLLTDQFSRTKPGRVVVIDWMLTCNF